MKTATLLISSVLNTIIIISATYATSNKTITSYDPAELLSKIFNPNVTVESRQRGHGFVKFEDQLDPETDPTGHEPEYGLIDNERDQRPVKFEDDYENQNYNPDFENGQHSEGNKPLRFEEQNQDLSFNNGVSFQDDNKVDDQGNKKKRRRRRRRKPKNGVLPHYQGAVGGPQLGRPGFQGPLQGAYGLTPYGNQGYPGYPGQLGAPPLRRPRRPKPRPSFATEALSSITEALTSIARYDDYQCVPRLLCEAAGGGALSGNGVLQSIAGIQPLLTLLSVYNGISSSPLFVFGRAVFLGMTSKGNTGTCRYAYPQCPTDPEQLIFYLNNHNGGFFRFFNAPQQQNQNLEQFYNQLSQGYGPDQLNSLQQNYGYPDDPNSNQNGQNQAYPRPEDYDNQNYGQRPGPYDRPGLYNNQNHGSNYAYDYNNYGSGNQIRFRDNDAKIEKRIQNKPAPNLADDSFEEDDVKTKWQFPENTAEDDYDDNLSVRDSRTLKFPDEGQSHNDQKDFNRKGKQSYFSENQSNHITYYNGRPHTFTNTRYQTTTYSYNNQDNYNNKYNNYNNRPNTYTNNNNNYKPPVKYHNYDYIPNQSNDNNKYQNQQSYYNNRQNIYNNNYKYPTTTYNNEDYVFDHKHNFYVKKENNYGNNNINNYANNNNYANSNNYASNNNNYENNKYINNYKRYEDNGINTVYVVRGNGDPNNPEIVKLRPGQSVH